MTDDIQSSLNEMLIEDNKKMREAGMELAEAALRVAKTYDGVHRLLLAVSKWSEVVANEGHRDRMYGKHEQDTFHSDQQSHYRIKV